MGATYRHGQVRVEWAASHLSFRIGMEVKLALMRDAVQRASVRDDKLVSADDVASALQSLNIAGNIGGGGRVGLWPKRIRIGFRRLRLKRP